jgi:hypothetical protein
MMVSCKANTIIIHINRDMEKQPHYITMRRVCQYRFFNRGVFQFWGRLSLRAESGTVFAGRSEAIPSMQEIASSHTTLLAMTAPNVKHPPPHKSALTPVPQKSTMNGRWPLCRVSARVCVPATMMHRRRT